MPQIIKLDNFTNGETTENKYGKFEKIYFKRSIELEDLNKNGYAKIEYDVNNQPYIEVGSNTNKTVLTHNSVNTSEIKANQLTLKGEDLENNLSKLTMKLEYLEKKVQDLELKEKVVSYDIDEDPCPDLYLIEFLNPMIGLFGVFKLNDSKKYLYLCYNIDNNVSYWKLVHNYNE